MVNDLRGHFWGKGAWHHKAIMKNRIADDFINLYPVSKTLRFELKPIGRTREYIERDGIIETDVVRSQNYTEVKVLID